MSTAISEITPDQDQMENASMEAFYEWHSGELPGPTATTDQLRKAALKEAEQYERACEKHDKAADKASWRLIFFMLRVVETFERDGQRDDEAFEAFLVENRAKPHGNSKSVYHRLAKACTPKGMKSDRVSKLGGAIAAMQKRGVRSETVEEELKKRLALTEGGELHSGVHRFFLLYQQDKRSNADEQPANSYMKWKPERLKKQAKLVLVALHAQRLVPLEFDQIVLELENAL